MAQEARELVCMITRGTDHELSSVGFTIANGGITAGLKVFIFLSSSGVDLVRKRAADSTQVNPLEPLSRASGEGYLYPGGSSRSAMQRSFERSRPELGRAEPYGNRLLLICRLGPNLGHRAANWPSCYRPQTIV
jgi:hypothetical protein